MAFDQLAEKMRHLDDIPLPIATIQVFKRTLLNIILRQSTPIRCLLHLKRMQGIIVQLQFKNIDRCPAGRESVVPVHRSVSTTQQCQYQGQHGAG